MPQLKEIHEKFLKHLKDNDRANATIIAYSKDTEQLISFLAERSKFLPNEVLKEDLDGFLEKLEKEAYTPKSISRKINAIRTFFKFLKSENLIEDDPSASLIHPKIEIKPPRILSAVEYRALRDACRHDPRTAAIVELLLQTGIRIGELRRLKTDDIEFGEDGKPGKMRVGEWGKTAEREVPLNKPAQTAVRDYLEERTETKEETVFVTKTGRPLLIRNIRTTINRYFKLAGVENVKVNDLRHTFVATHLSRGVSLTTISKLAGHRRLTTTEKYLEHIESPSEEKVDLGEL